MESTKYSPRYEIVPLKLVEQETKTKRKDFVTKFMAGNPDYMIFGYLY